MYDRYTKPSCWRNLAKHPTAQCAMWVGCDARPNRCGLQRPEGPQARRDIIRQMRGRGRARVWQERTNTQTKQRSDHRLGAQRFGVSHKVVLDPRPPEAEQTPCLAPQRFYEPNGGSVKMKLAIELWRHGELLQLYSRGRLSTTPYSVKQSGCLACAGRSVFDLPVSARPAGARGLRAQRRRAGRTRRKQK